MLCSSIARVIIGGVFDKKQHHLIQVNSYYLTLLTMHWSKQFLCSAGKSSKML